MSGCVPSSLHRLANSSPSRPLIWLEWSFWFVLFPFIAFLNWFSISKFLFFALPLLYALALASVSRGQPEPFPAEAATTPRRIFRWRIARMVGVVGAIALLAWIRHPEDFCNLPRERTRLWLMILILYPVLSALPQEFLYRRFYLRRYQAIFGRRGVLLWSNVGVFGWLHLMYDNVTAVVLTLLGGWLFASTYLKTGRLFLPWLEHTLYGLAIFTFGLGRYFYEPIGG